MNLFENVLYINLEHREDRKAHVLDQLSKFGVVNPERFSAVKTANGAVGCGLSHIKCLELAKSRGWETVCIIEDDFKCMDTNKFLNSVRQFEKQDFIEWDVLLLGGNNVPPYYTSDGIDYCVQISNCQTTVGYVVKRSFYDTLIQNMREAVKNLVQTGNKKLYAIDMYWKRLQSSKRWYLITPLTITQHTCFSDVEQQTYNYDHLMLDIDKPWLFSSEYQQKMLQNMTCIKRKT